MWRIKAVNQIYGLTLLVSLFMGIGSFSFAMLAQDSGYPLHYGYAYSSMALSGALTRAMLPKFKASWMIRLVNLGLLVYALSIALRLCLYSSSLAVLSGVLGGFGATVVLSYISLVMMQVTEEHADYAHQIYGRSATLSRIAEFMAVFVASNLLAISFLGTRGAILVSATGFILLVFYPKSSGIVFSPKHTSDRKQHTRILVKMAVTDFVYGCMLAMIGVVTPMALKFLLKDTVQVGWLTNLELGVTLLCSVLWGHRYFGKQSGLWIAFAAMVLAVCYGMVPVNQLNFLGMMMLFAALLPLMTQLQSTFFFKVRVDHGLDKTMVLTVGHIAFLLGDMLGAPLATSAYQYLGLAMTVRCFCGISLIFAISFVGLWYRDMRTTR